MLVRLLARNSDGSAMSDRDIRQSNPDHLSIADIKHLSYLPSWTTVPVGLMRCFVVACRLDFSNREHMRNANRYLKDPKFTHLRRDPNFPAFREMLRVYYDSLTK